MLMDGWMDGVGKEMPRRERERGREGGRGGMIEVGNINAYRYILWSQSVGMLEGSFFLGSEYRSIDRSRGKG